MLFYCMLLMLFIQKSDYYAQNISFINPLNHVEGRCAPPPPCLGFLPFTQNIITQPIPEYS